MKELMSIDSVLSRMNKKDSFVLIIYAVTIGLFASLLAISLMGITEYFEHQIFHSAKQYHPLVYIFLPTIGITSIYYLRKYVFHNKKNKGISEIYNTLDYPKDHLPLFKLPSHYINGFLTVIFGGSTGIEVSTVVATATLGNTVYKKDFGARAYKRELVSAGVAAGIAILFNSPIAGWLFAWEVIAKKMNRAFVLCCTIATFVAWIFLQILHPEPILPIAVTGWNWYAIPFMIVLSLFGGSLSIYFTILVLRIKGYFSGINNNFIRVNLGALAVGTMICFFPFIYGDSYHALEEMIGGYHNYSILFLLFIAFLKPLASSLTLGAGGDGGVFAPSIVAGAFLGVAFALICNVYLGTSLQLLNFALIGAATTLSAAIYAPFTSLFLICNLVPNGYELFFPLLICCLIANFFAKLIFPYNVYTYDLDKKVSNH
ncbi:MAG TPA: chloride channel protein [Chitinophagales bacterium]|nr:chloride channel protein [Chitinophagales bacterium]HMV02521.1 chloride channel protein [Chitinophagales bacterium]HMW94604.1 chloride channel protein [Chitinophagales bacterium]HMY42444.1 chloride channel protein [Chitinophagales bacterium]HMZ68220.1 chloride channel protein [Chitinophagales bacterium]